MALYAGCDIGIHGFWCVLNDKSELVWHRPMPLVKGKFCAHAVWQLLCDLDDFAADQFEDIVIGIESPLSLPSDVNKVTLLIKMVEKNPTPELFENLYKELKKTDGRKGTLSMGTNYGIIKGQVVAKGWKHQFIPPRTWMKILHENTQGNLPAKMRSMQAAKALWPAQSFIPAGCRKESSDWIDSILIAEYTRRQLR